jgi:hypothetical protein
VQKNVTILAIVMFFFIIKKLGYFLNGILLAIIVCYVIVLIKARKYDFARIFKESGL